jgi:GxxExxY protein
MNENQLSHLVIGNAIQVHRQLGPGLLENVYKECLAHALMNAGANVQKEVPVPVVFQGIKLGCGYRLDLLVESKLVIEIKSVEQLNDIHLAQVLTYLRLGDYKLGLLLNFNVIRMMDGCRRVINGQIEA